ncbi:hypothetical protein Hanom_Chr16g01447861 [Helianthus anomalus]
MIWMRFAYWIQRVKNTNHRDSNQDKFGFWIQIVKMYKPQGLKKDFTCYTYIVMSETNHSYGLKTFTRLSDFFSSIIMISENACVLLILYIDSC